MISFSIAIREESQHVTVCEVCLVCLVRWRAVLSRANVGPKIPCKRGRLKFGSSTSELLGKRPFSRWHQSMIIHDFSLFIIPSHCVPMVFRRVMVRCKPHVRMETQWWKSNWIRSSGHLRPPNPFGSARTWNLSHLVSETSNFGPSADEGPSRSGR
jgi:hypothetical protein